MALDREELDWLDILISSYNQEHDWENDEDTLATQEMVSS